MTKISMQLKGMLRARTHVRWVMGYLTVSNSALPVKEVPYLNLDSPGLALQPPRVPLGLLRVYLQPQMYLG